MKNINWEKIFWNALKIFIVILLNTPTITYLIGWNIPFAKIQMENYTLKLSWIDYLRLSDKVEWYHIWILYFFMVLTWVLTFCFIKWLISEAKRTKQHLQNIEIQKQNAKTIVDAIQAKNQKQLEKDEKEIRKYLGE